MESEYAMRLCEMDTKAFGSNNKRAAFANLKDAIVKNHSSIQLSIFDCNKLH